MTQAQLAGRELSGGYVSLIECGHREPSNDALRVIASRLDLQIDELLRGTPPGLVPELELCLYEARRRFDGGDHERALADVAVVVEAARQHALNRVEARAEEALGDFAEAMSDLDAALAHFMRANDLWKGEPIHLRVDALSGIARCSRFLGDARMAVHTLDSYRRDLLAVCPDPHALVKTHTELIQGYFAIGLPESARDAAYCALQLAGQIEDPYEIACMHVTLARTLMYEGKFEDALVSVRRAHETYSAGGWRNKAIRAKIAEGIILSKKRDYELARARLLDAVELLTESPDRLDEALALNELGRVSRHLHDLPGALAHLERARGQLVSGDVLEQAFNERETGICLALFDDPDAEPHLRRAFDLYRASGAADDLAATCKALGNFYLTRGDTARGVAILLEGLDYIEHRST